jgi:membrane-associated phospholipid phosphatase
VSFDLSRPGSGQPDSVEVASAAGEARDIRLWLGCRNAGTGERGTARLFPETVARAGGGFRAELSLAQAWPLLPYPVDRAGIESKPMAIIDQQTHRSPYSISEGALRRRFAAVAGYMLETAGHHYRLPVGDGRLDCRFDASAVDGAGRRIAAGRSARFSVDFGRGLPDATYPRDRSLPDLSRRPLWALGNAVPAVPAPAPADSGPTDLEALGARRASAQRDLRHWDDGSAVSPWIEITLDQIATHPSVDPPHAARALALVSVAAYDAAVLAGRAARAYGRAAPCRLDPRIVPLDGCSAVPSYPSEHVAVAGAASRVLAALFPNRGARFDMLAAEEETTLLRAGWNLRSDLDAGLELGHAVGDRVVDYGRRDGSDAVWHGTVPTDAGKWRPTPPGFDAQPADPLAGTWRSWNIDSGSEFRPPPPPAPGSPAFEANVREVYRVGKTLSTEHQEIASFWEDKLGSFTPPGHWNAIALHLVRQHRLSTPDAALVFATLNTAQADAFIACWDAKYAYWSERPVTAIRAEVDPGWSPYIYTPPFPSYPSGHSTTSGAASVVLAHFFPSEAAQLRSMARQAGWSRILGGIHFPADNTAGLALGRKVGAAALARVAASG